MRNIEIEWDEENIDHIWSHIVEPDEVEEVIMSKIPKFQSIKEEREFWDNHSAFELLDEDKWEVVEAGTTKVQSVYTTKVRKKGATFHLPKELLNRIGARDGQTIRVRTEKKKLIVEFA